jgi:hypothetical protein
MSRARARAFDEGRERLKLAVIAIMDRAVVESRKLGAVLGCPTQAFFPTTGGPCQPLPDAVIPSQRALAQAAEDVHPRARLCAKAGRFARDVELDWTHARRGSRITT